MASVEQTQEVIDQAKELFETGKELFEAHTSSIQHGKGSQQGAKATQKKEQDVHQGKQKLEQAKQLFEQVLRMKSEEEDIQKLKEIALYRLGDINAKLGYVHLILHLLFHILIKILWNSEMSMHWCPSSKKIGHFSPKWPKPRQPRLVRQFIILQRTNERMNERYLLCSENID
jgi:hypothetical protein